MPNPIIETQFDPPDPNATPLNLVQLFQLANALVHSEMKGNYNSYVLQKGTPDQRDQDKVWIQKDEQGRPVSIKVFWNGSWRRVYNGMPGEIRGYHGDPGTDFDTTGWGKSGEEYDGWHLCNGKDGSPDFSDQFLVSAHMNNNDGVNGYQDGEWVTIQTDKGGTHNGGKNEIRLTEETTWRPVNQGIPVDHFQNTADHPRNPDGHLYGTPDDSTDFVFAKDEGNLQPEVINIIPPFIALGWIIFLGYRT